MILFFIPPFLFLYKHRNKNNGSLPTFKSGARKLQNQQFFKDSQMFFLLNKTSYLPPRHLTRKHDSIYLFYMITQRQNSMTVTYMKLRDLMKNIFIEQDYLHENQNMSPVWNILHMVNNIQVSLFFRTKQFRIDCLK